MEQWNGEWVAEFDVYYTDGSITAMTALANFGNSPHGPNIKFPEEVVLDLTHFVQWYNVFRVTVFMVPTMDFININGKPVPRYMRVDKPLVLTYKMR